MKKFYLILVLFQFIFNFNYAQEITGDWHGLANFEGSELRISVHITAVYSAYVSGLGLFAHG